MDIVCREGWARAGPWPRLLPNGGNRGDRDTFHVSFDPASEDVVEVVVRAVATIRNVEPYELDPLNTTIDPDALEQLVDSPGTLGDLSVTFVYQALEITVNADGDVWLKWR